MKHIVPIFSLSFSALLLIFVPSYANAFSQAPTKSFGGKIYTAPIPGVICNGVGRLMILSSNASSLLGTLGTGQISKSKAESVAKGIYGAIPTYATDPQKTPIPGRQILGRQKIIPNLNICYIPTPAGKIPIPVLETKSNYNVSNY